MPRPKVRTNVKQTSMRIPMELYDELRRRSKEAGVPAEQIMYRALWKELNAPNPAADTEFRAAEFYKKIEAAMEEFRQGVRPDLNLSALAERKFQWSEPEAYRYLQSLPLPCKAVIKDKDARIMFCNRSMERACRLTLDDMVGKAVDHRDIGVLTEEEGGVIRKDIAQVIKDGKPLESLEAVRFPQVGSVTLRVHRFMFEANTQTNMPTRFLGDLSFDYGLETQEWGYAETRAPEPFHRLSASYPPALFTSFLENASDFGVAIKDTQRRFLHVNAVFRARAGGGDLVGKTVEANLGRPFEYRRAVSEGDQRVLNDKVWVFAKHWLDQKKGETPLFSLRFPILDERGQVERIGVLNGYFTMQIERQTNAGRTTARRSVKSTARR